MAMSTRSARRLHRLRTIAKLAPSFGYKFKTGVRGKAAGRGTPGAFGCSSASRQAKAS